MENKFIETANFIRKMGNDDPNEDKSTRAEKVVRNHVLWAMGAGLIPIPIADFVAVAAVQLDMVRTVSNTYGIDFRESEGKALITSLTGSGLSRMGANALVKLIPGVGTALGGVSMAVVSGASTYALGQVFKRHFEHGGTILDFDTNRFEQYYNEQFEKGKTVAQEMKQDRHKTDNNFNNTTFEQPQQPDAATFTNVEPVDVTPKPDASELVIKKLKDLGELKEMGVLTEEEFTQMKTQLIKNYQ